MTRNKQALTVLGLLLFADGLLLLAGSLTMFAKAVQLPLWGGFIYAMYLDNPESFHKTVSPKVIFWSIFGILAALAALVVLGLIIR
jgi:hypothetical protein